MTETQGKRFPIRWLTLGEIVGLVAVVLAALGYWDSHRERVAADKARQAEIASQALKQTFLMTGTLNGQGDALRLTSVDADQVIQTQTVWFPRAIRPDSVETTGNPRLEADWIADGVGQAAPKAKAGRIPVGVLTVFIENGQTKTDRALYDLGYSRHRHLLIDERVSLEGLSLIRRGVVGDLQTAADQIWAKR